MSGADVNASGIQGPARGGLVARIEVGSRQGWRCAPAKLWLVAVPVKSEMREAAKPALAGWG
jgi:hypothetical protein